MEPVTVIFQVLLVEQCDLANWTDGGGVVGERVEMLPNEMYSQFVVTGEDTTELRKACVARPEDLCPSNAYIAPAGAQLQNVVVTILVPDHYRLLDR